MKLNTQFYRNEDDGAGGGAPEVTPDGTVAAQTVNVTIGDDQLDRMADRIAQTVAPATEDDPLNDLPEDLRYEVDPVRLAAHLRDRDVQMEARLTAKLQAQQAPLIVSSQKSALVSGMDETAKAYIETQIAHLPMESQAAILSNPQTADMLKKAAMFESMQKQGVKIPGTHQPAPGGLDDMVPTSEVESMMRAFGVTRERATELVKQAMKETAR
jgi:hypothetical protein